MAAVTCSCVQVIGSARAWPAADTAAVRRPQAGDTYAFRLYANLNMVPAACAAAGVTAASAVRYANDNGGGGGGGCVQLGPDMEVDPAYVVRRAPVRCCPRLQLGDSSLRLLAWSRCP